jgi:hypothetical protein
VSAVVPCTVHQVLLKNALIFFDSGREMATLC